MYWVNLSLPLPLHGYFKSGVEAVYVRGRHLHKNRYLNSGNLPCSCATSLEPRLMNIPIVWTFTFYLSPCLDW